MRDPKSKNPRQQSIYVPLPTWAVAKELAALVGLSISGWIVSLIQRERAKKFGKDWEPK